MHESAYIIGKHFFDIYTNENSKILEIGSQNVNGSLRDHSKSQNYTGIDFANGKGVDVVLDNPYKYPFEENTFDIVVTSSCFEHSEMFWLSFIESLRVLKPEGIFYSNVPAVFPYHRFPVDCWRFMPDSSKALETWAKYNHINAKLIESFVVRSNSGTYDCCSVYVKESNYYEYYTDRVYKRLTLNPINIYDGNSNSISNFDKMGA